MDLNAIKTLRQVSKESGIPIKTLQTRLNLPSFNMVEGEDFKKLGDRQPILLSPQGIRKITKRVYDETRYCSILNYDMKEYSWKEANDNLPYSYIIVSPIVKAYVNVELDDYYNYVSIEDYNNYDEMANLYFCNYDNQIIKYFDLLTRHRCIFLPWNFKVFIDGYKYFDEENELSIKEEYFYEYSKTHNREECISLAHLLRIRNKPILNRIAAKERGSIPKMDTLEDILSKNKQKYIEEFNKL